MDVRAREDSQSRRPSLKRPWEEDTGIAGEPSHGWDNKLPPMEGARYGVPTPRSERDAAGSYEQYPSASSRDSAIKRARHSPHAYNILSRENLDLNGRLLQAQSRSPTRIPSRAAVVSPMFSLGQRNDGWETRQVAGLETAGSADTVNLCRRCRQLTTSQRDENVPASCEDCSRDPGLDRVTKQAAAALNRLAKTLSSIHAMLPPERPSKPHDEAWEDCPPIAQAGLRQTLDWILNSIHSVTDLADKVVQQVPARLLDVVETRTAGDRSRAYDEVSMKRRLDVTTEDDLQSRNEAAGPISGSNPYSRRCSLVPGENPNDSFEAFRSRHGYRGPPIETDGSRVPIMNPPPAPSRQLPSPPARSLSSPTSAGFPSPSVTVYGTGPRPSYLSIQHTSLSAHLPPMGSSQIPDALQAHSAALQHEVSVQKIALSSLQGEHDKLLAAFSRSQLRAATLEKKFTVSDNEINMLSEERLRLQNQVQELEKDVEDLTRKNDETRQTAVRDGAQYVEIVKKASMLEGMAAEERKRWNESKAELIREIEAVHTTSERGANHSSFVTAMAGHPETDRVLTLMASAEVESTIKVEPRSQPGLAEIESDTSRELREEVDRLRSRCAAVEGALRDIHNDYRSMEGMLESLNRIRNSTSERVSRALQDDDGPLDGGGDVMVD